MNIEERNSIVINPEFKIGTQFWVINRMTGMLEIGIIAAYDVRVTSCVNTNMSWHYQIFNNLFKGKKQSFKCYFRYYAKIQSDIYEHFIEKNNKEWFINDRKIYFSKEEYIKSIQIK